MELEPNIEATYIPNTSSKDKQGMPYLSRINIYLDCYSEEAIFRVRIYKLDENLFPGEDMVSLPIQKTFKGKKIINIDLDDYLLVFPPDGVFIGVELIIDDINITKLKNSEGFETSLLSPFLHYQKSISQNEFYRYSGGKWNKKFELVPQNFKSSKQKYYKPSISLEIKRF